MRVLVSLEERFQRTPDGKVWSAGAASYSFWKRYLDEFEEVRILARATDVAEAPLSWKQADGPGVKLEALPYYVGPIAYAKKYFPIRAAVRKVLEGSDAIILRVASPIASFVQRQLAPTRPFAVEVVGDPYEVFAPGSVSHPLRAFLRYQMTAQLKHQCEKACAVAYVTDHALPQRYPSHLEAFTTTYSSIDLRDDAFAANPRSWSEPLARPGRIVSIGTLEVPYKGFDVLLDAAAICIKSGLPLELEIIGDGRCRADLEARAERSGVAKQVSFAGQVASGAAIRQRLDSADLFALASKTEGLPRAMIEAMARGLPCIGSEIGGIPELLAREELFPRGDAPALARKIHEVLSDPARMARLSVENLAKARSYHDSMLSARRREFFRHVREVTSEWNLTRTRTSVELRAQRDANSLQTERMQ